MKHAMRQDSANAREISHGTCRKTIEA